MLGQHIQLCFAAEYFKLLQLLAVVHLHWLAASRILKHEYVASRLHAGIAMVTCAGCTVLLIVASTDTTDTRTQCLSKALAHCNCDMVTHVCMFITDTIHVCVCM